MNAEEFVDAIRSQVRDHVADDIVETLLDPPGRQPDPKLIELSEWFKSLPEPDRKRVHEIAAMASDDATFGFLAVLDGVRVIEDGADQGSLQLFHVKDGESTLLNDPHGPLLHELLEPR